jgi:diguanylate cyclase (GGDEF)-like protein
LPNRALLTGRLSQALTLARRHGRRVALLYLDLDNFKQINDLHGHAAGDQLLHIAARRLQEHVRQSDTVCRQGGDEFLVLLAEVEAGTDASLLAEELILALSDTYLIGGHDVHVTVSIGISVFPDDCSDVEAMVVNADTAMYHAKRSGRSRAQLFAPDMSLRAVIGRGGGRA